MRKITSFKTAILAVVMMAAFVNASAANINVANIAALKTANATLAFSTTSSDIFTITGEVIVTFVSSSSATPTVRTIYIQDATGALMIYDSGKLYTSSPALYSGLTGITGNIKSYSGILELIPTITLTAATSTGNTPFAPVVTTLDHLIDYPLQVAKVNGVTISDFTTYTSGTTTYTPNGLFQAGKNFPLSIGGVTSTTVLRTSYADVNYINTTIPTTAPQNITGLVLPYQANATAAFIVDLVPRSSADITIATGISAPSADLLTVSRSGNTLTVSNVANGSTVEIYSAVGAKVQTAQLVNSAVQLNSLSKGLYVVRVGNQSSKIMM